MDHKVMTIAKIAIEGMAQFVPFWKVELVDPKHLFFDGYQGIIDGSDRFGRLDNGGFDNVAGGMGEDAVAYPNPQSYGEE